MTVTLTAHLETVLIVEIFLDASTLNMCLNHPCFFLEFVHSLYVLKESALFTKHVNTYTKFDCFLFFKVNLHTCNVQQ